MGWWCRLWHCKNFQGRAMHRNATKCFILTSHFYRSSGIGLCSLMARWDLFGSLFAITTNNCLPTITTNNCAPTITMKIPNNQIGRPLLSPAGAVGRGNFRPGKITWIYGNQTLDHQKQITWINRIHQIPSHLIQSCHQVPMFILGGFAVSSGILTMAFLPETLGAGLPEVISNATSAKSLDWMETFWMSSVTEIDRQLPQYFSVSFTSGPGRHCQPENQLQIHVDMRQTKEEELVLYFFVFCSYMILIWSFTYMATYFKK